MAFERGKFGLEYDLRQKDESSGGLGWVVAAIAFVALVSLAWTLIGRFRSNAEDAEIDIVAAEEPQKIETPPAANPPPPAYADAHEPPLPAELPPAPAFPFKRPVAVQTGLVVQVSESLRNAGFAFDPPVPSNATPFSVSANLVFNGDGLVESILINSFASAGAKSDMARWEVALLLSHATSNATGSVVITQP